MCSRDADLAVKGDHSRGDGGAHPERVHPLPGDHAARAELAGELAAERPPVQDGHQRLRVALAGHRSAQLHRASHLGAGYEAGHVLRGRLHLERGGERAAALQGRLRDPSTATFSEAMAPATLSTATFKVAAGAALVAGTVTSTGLTATFRPTAALANGTLFTATVTVAATDLAGNALATSRVWSFTTSAAADTSAPTVASTLPLSAATGVLATASVRATFSEAMAAQTSRSGRCRPIGSTRPSPNRTRRWFSRRHSTRRATRGWRRAAAAWRTASAAARPAHRARRHRGSR